MFGTGRIYFPGYLNKCDRAVKIRLNLVVGDIKYYFEIYGSETLL
jgi:hypothetical protein